MLIFVTFKSGAQIVFDCADFETGRNGITGRLERITWETPEGATSKLHGIYAMEEVVAIVALSQPGWQRATTDTDSEEVPK